jgi:ubiquitin carboxyl-terminal hydrolase 22/27/51
VYHPLFDQERERLDLQHGLPWMAWREHAVQRSFDAFCFVRTEEQGLVWRGLLATYPILVPSEHVKAARLSLERRAMFQGRLDYPWLSLSSGHRAAAFASFQRLHGK